MNKTAKKKAISRISALHYAKLIFRSCLFLIASFIYVTDRVKGVPRPLERLDVPPAVMVFIWLVFIVEMIFRFFPSRLESIGCQKQFRSNYIPSGKEFAAAVNPGEPPHSTMIVAGSWFLLNGLIFSLFFFDVIDGGILILISIAYSVCDMICILFFCPFQEWMMKNKCCGSCPIYHWDYAMMFTPLLPLQSFYAQSLLFISIALLINWEIYFRLHPERFYENTNLALSCNNCKEKLCSHKKSLRTFLIKRSEIIKKPWKNPDT